MPFTGELPYGKKRRVVIQLRGPRTAAQQKRLKAALQKLLKQHNAAIQSPAKKKRPPRTR